MRTYYVYILTTHENTALYVGMTNNVVRRLAEHKSDLYNGFTQRYNVHKLIYVESFGEVKDAIQREKQIKGWTRAKKIELVNTVNPTWDDLTRRWEV